MKLFKSHALAAVLFSGLLVACSTTTTLEAVTDFDASFDFSKVQKIAIQPVERMNAAAVHVSDMDVNRLNQIISDQLTSKGFSIVAENSEADMYLTWHLVTQEKTNVRSYNSMSAYNCWRCGPAVSDVSVQQFTEGTLIVDIVDPKRGQSVWRSTVQSRLKSKVNAQDSQALRLEAGRALFVEFPPR